MWSVPLCCLLPRRDALPCHACVPCLQAKSLESDISLQSHYSKIFLAFRAPLHRNTLGGINLNCLIDYITQKIVWGINFAIISAQVVCLQSCNLGNTAFLADISCSVFNEDNWRKGKSSRTANDIGNSRMGCMLELSVTVIRCVLWKYRETICRVTITVKNCHRHLSYSYRTRDLSNS